MSLYNRSRAAIEARREAARREAAAAAKAEAERVERERRAAAAAKAEAERVERERIAAAAAKAEAERVERERIGAAAKAEAERVERERRAAAAKAEAERLEIERTAAAAKAAEAERLERERAAKADARIAFIKENYNDVAKLEAFFADKCDLPAAKALKLAEYFVADRKLHSTKKLGKAYLDGFRLSPGIFDLDDSELSDVHGQMALLSGESSSPKVVVSPPTVFDSLMPNVGNIGGGGPPPPGQSDPNAANNNNNNSNNNNRFILLDIDHI